MFFKEITFYLVYPLFYLIGIMPRGFQNGLARVLYFSIYKVVKYRVKVVGNNLRNAFGDKSQSELLEIEKKFYRHLADVFVETIVMASISKKEMMERMDFINADQIEEYTKGRSWICAMAHYGSWEYTISWGLHSTHDTTTAVYHPLANVGFDKYYRHTRSRFGVTPVTMKGVSRHLLQLRSENKTTALALIADQTPPPWIDNWVEFLNQPTTFFEGMERLALKFSMPVAFLHVDKFDGGRYRAWFEVIYDGKEQVADGEITRRYASRLQDMIRRRPELWMWSHRRWKWKPNENQIVGKL